MKRKTKSEARQEAFRKFELSMKTLLSEDKIRIFNTAFNMGWDIARKKIEKKDNNHFKEKCICRWSKDNEYGFIPNTICPVHGKDTLEQIRKTVPYENNSQHPRIKPDRGEELKPKSSGSISDNDSSADNINPKDKWGMGYIK